MRLATNKGESKDEIAQNRFAAYLQKCLSRSQRDYLAHKAQEREIPMSPDELGELLEEKGGWGYCGQISYQDFSPTSWEHLMDSITNIRLFCFLNRLEEEEKCLLFLRVICELSCHDIAKYGGLSVSQAMNDYACIIRKLRRWFGLEEDSF